MPCEILPDTNPHGKVQKYASVLQWFLSVVRQGEQEKGALTHTPPGDEVKGMWKSYL